MKILRQKHFEKTSDTNKGHRGEIFSLVGPLFLWMLLFLALPLVYVIIISFLEKGIYGGVQMIFTLENYTALWNNNFTDDIYTGKLYRPLESHLRESDLALHCTGFLDQPDLPAHLLPVRLYFIEVQQKISGILHPADHAALLDQPADPLERMEQYSAGFRHYQHDPVKTRYHFRADHNDVHRRRHPVRYGICTPALYGAAPEQLHFQAGLLSD